ncbi:hypothetical protein SAMN05421874_14318 [Nonomuraea maritima]|uniref:IrrE N-terminal-like domain-containing protein n=1 Tax=Nonomuraea maritima TaxID=683260 RepID=A0A1G9R4Y0_9ACTN|nr:hypothetical protein [Nonomuraea maritima]SDM18372.1 hypothetical protein SAMN05421874_14318 [Nonomuraea maritima]
MRVPPSVAAALNAVPPPHPFDLDLYLSLVQDARGRRILIHDLPRAAVAAVCGAWIPWEGVDHVFIDPAADGLHRDHIIAHEIGHMFLDTTAGRNSGIDTTSLRLLLATVGAPPTVAVAARSGTDAHERDVELFALLTVTGQAPPRQSSRIDRVFSALDYP